tara:strand:- start:32 stop:370 length:339 start_codon:yes stop_codon:yes gene_type:complete
MKMKEENQCPNCRSQEVQQLKNDLHKCKEGQKAKDRKIKALDKKVFILTIIAVGIGAIFGKEALDAITEWLGSIGEFNSAASNLSAGVHPSPGTLPIFAMAFFMTKKTRRRK